VISPELLPDDANIIVSSGGTDLVVGDWRCVVSLVQFAEDVPLFYNEAAIDLTTAVTVFLYHESIPCFVVEVGADRGKACAEIMNIMEECGKRRWRVHLPKWVDE
jgi:hypothetical protein